MGMYFIDERLNRIGKRYRTLAAAAGIVNQGPPDAKLWQQATEAVDAELRVESVRLSVALWSSELADIAAELVADVTAGRADSVMAANSLIEPYARARTTQYRSKLADTGQDVCRACSRVKPAPDIELVLIYKVSVAHHQDFDALKHEQEFAIVCSACRAEKPMQPVTLRQIAGPPIAAHIFTKVYPAVKVGGLFWAKLKDDGTFDDYDLSADGCTSQPLSARTGPPAILHDLAGSLGLPPELKVIGTGEKAKVMIQLRGYLLDLRPRGECLAALRTGLGPAVGVIRQSRCGPHIYVQIYIQTKRNNPATTNGAGFTVQKCSVRFRSNRVSRPAGLP